jgi:hypothetical protein
VWGAKVGHGEVSNGFCPILWSALPHEMLKLTAHSADGSTIHCRSPSGLRENAEAAAYPTPDAGGGALPG